MTTTPKALPALPDEPAGFSDLPQHKFCLNPSHLMPSHLHIPPGKKYVHYCPGCGQKSVAIGAMS